MVTFRNFTTRRVKLNDGRTFECEGVARMVTFFTGFDDNGICFTRHGKVLGLPEPEDGVYYIVSSEVMAASNRTDLVTPAIGHLECVINKKGDVESVPGFIGKEILGNLSKNTSI